MADKLVAHTALYDGVLPKQAEELSNALRACGYTDRDYYSVNTKAYFEAHLQVQNETDLIEIDIISAEFAGFFVDLRVSINGRIV